MKLFDSLSQVKKSLKKRPEGRLSLFVCGPTVYDYSHIGHARTYIVFDSLVKYIKLTGFRNVYYLQNITDIDDKIIEQARKSNKSAKFIARKFEKAYLEDMESLWVNSVTRYARASDYIPAIITQIQRLLNKKHAYQKDGDVFYDIHTFPTYGKLSKQRISHLKGEREIYAVEKKKNEFDFALWKRKKFEHEPSWSSPWGAGRPGWHIEDTAITEKVLGAQYDLHGGGRDLIFPHHESEIAQMEAISEKVPMVSIWVHTGFVTVAGKKMSKSLRNVVTIRDFIHNNSAEILRFFILSHHYRSPVNYNEKNVLEKKHALLQLYRWVSLLRTPNYSVRAKSIAVDLHILTKKLFQALDDDFNTPKALGLIFEFLRRQMSAPDIYLSKNRKKILQILFHLDAFLGIGLKNIKPVYTPDRIAKLAKIREEFRKRSKWVEADRIRKELLAKGWIVEDTISGLRLRKNHKL